MNKIKAKVISTEIGRFDVDSMAVNIDGEVISICFDKNKNIMQYENKEVFIINDNGIFDVEFYVEDIKSTNSKK